MIKPTSTYLTIYQGATFSETFTWVAGDTNIPVNLTGYSARLQVKDNYDGLVILELNTTNGGIVFPSPLTSGVINLFMSAASTSVLNFSMAIWDLILIASDGTVTRLLNGRMALSPGVTL
jgi:hypothetical protein